MVPALQIFQTTKDFAVIVALKGRLDSNTSSELDRTLRQITGSGSVKIIIDLTETEFISSSGLRVMLLWLRRLRKMQGDLKIACLQPRIRDVLFLAGFNRIFILYDTVAAALESFSFADLDEHEKRVLDIVASTLDIEDDLKRTRESLVQSEALYRTIFESSGTAMAIIDEDMTIVLANSEFEKLTGYARDELCEILTLLPFVVREDLGMVMEFHDIVRKELSNEPRHYEFRFKDRDGNIRIVYVLLDMVPQTTRRIYSLLDITELRKIEEDLRHELTRKREFIILTAHELRTPLQPVLGYLHMILEEPEAFGVSGELRTLLMKCSEHVDEVRETIEHIIKLSDLGYGPEQMLPRFKPRYRETSPKSLLAAYISVLKSSGDLDITLTIPDDLRIITDSEYFFLIMQSLIFNSIRYSQGPAQIEISASSDQRCHRFTIQNRNALIPQEIIPNLFKPFSVSKESKLLEKFGFIGISLPVAQKMAELLSGDITASAEPGNGSRFTLVLSRNGIDSC